MSAPIILGTAKVSALLRKYAYPSIIAMTAASLYNVVDSIFIGHGVGAMALSALSVVFPFQNLAAAFGMLIGVGASTLISIRLGEKDYETCERILGNVVVLKVLIGMLFTVISLLCLDPVLVFFGATPGIIGYAREYMTVILLGNVVTHTYMGLNSLLRATGHPWRAMVITLFTVVFNAVLNPIFLFLFDWGIQGVALATVVSQFVALVWQVRMFNRPNEMVRFQRGIYALKWRIVSDSFRIGLAPFMMQVASCFIVILINHQLKVHAGELAIGAYGIVNRVAFLFLMIVMGLGQGMQPILGYNYGAKSYDRVLEVLKLTMISGTVVTSVGFVLVECFPKTIAHVFTTNEELVDLAVTGLRYGLVFFPFIASVMISGSFFQSIGSARKAIVLSLSRQVLFLTPLLLWLPELFGVRGVWLSLPISDALAVVVASVMIGTQVKELKSRMVRS